MRTWIDGVEATALPLPDRALDFGDGLFETIAVVGGRPRALERHLARLGSGCERLGLVVPDVERLSAEIAAAAAAPGTGVVKLLLCRLPGAAGAHESATRRVVRAEPPRARPAEWAQTGVVARWCTLRLAEQPALAGLKHLNRLEYVLARREWADDDVAEGLLRDVHDRVVCGTMTNVYAVLDNRVVTPALERCGVAGIVRAELLEALPRAGVEVAVRDLRPGEFARASEVFLSNALIGIWPVRRLGGSAWAPGPVAARARALLEGR